MRIHGDGNRDLKDVWVYLTAEEAVELLQALEVWAEEEADGNNVPDGWHTHITDSGRELSVSVDPGDDGIKFAKPS